ncbi:hypothetical protein H7B90_13005 [Cohnella xylanilytica]|uniref:Phage protein n=1 Tax=Cohnella xylanilytica TaxID=557555 RepID=A0A841U1T6_9BACL|nr:hypothetical protein [Cohnella xylanilytica]MBB6692323.1 hypothetical protein [Cohnella xylanilytica]
MKFNELDTKLQEVVNRFNTEMKFNLDTFEQSHDGDQLTKRDMEEISRQVFYALNDFRRAIVEFVKSEGRA